MYIVRKKNILLKLISLTIIFTMLLPVFSYANENTKDDSINPSEYSVDYNIKFSLDPNGLPQEVKHGVDWQTFLDKISFEGHADYKNLFKGKEEQIFGTLNILLNDKIFFDINHNGNQEYLWLSSKAFPTTDLFLMMFNYYEFMLKGYFFLGLPTQYIALLTFPYGVYAAFDPFIDLFNETFTTSTGNRVISNENLIEYGNKISNIMDNEYPTYQFFRALFLEYGLNDILYMELMNIPNWLEEISNGEDLYIRDNGQNEVYTLASNDILIIDKSSEEFSINLDLPVLDGYKLDSEINYEKSDSNYIFDAKLTSYINGLNDFSIIVTADGLPGKNTYEGNGTIKIIVNGDMIGEDIVFNLAHNWSYEDKNNNKHVYLNLDLINNITKKKSFNLVSQFDIYPFSDDIFPEKAEYSTNDFFSLNDASLQRLKDENKIYIIKLLAPLLLETPRGVIDDIWDYIDKQGILSMLFTK